MMDTSSTCKSSLDLDLTVDSPQKWTRTFSSGPPFTAITDGQARGVEVQRIIEVVRLSTLESVLRAQFTLCGDPAEVRWTHNKIRRFSLAADA